MPGTRQVTTRLADGLALAVITAAPLAVDDSVTGRGQIELRNPQLDPHPPATGGARCT